jgi:hypothetical protein
MLGSSPRARRGEHGDVVATGQRSDPLDMIDVFVGDQDAVQGLRRAVDTPQTPLDFAATEPRVQQDARLRRFKLGAIPLASAPQDTGLQTRLSHASLPLRFPPRIATGSLRPVN